MLLCACVLKESEDAVKALAKEKDMLEREKWDLRRQTKEATEQANVLRSQMDMKENRVKELEAELTMVSHNLVKPDITVSPWPQYLVSICHECKPGVGLESCFTFMSVKALELHSFTIYPHSFHLSKR